MKLDTRALRYLTSDDWRVLTAVEQGSKNHELVPTPLIQQIAGLRGSNSVHKCISNLAKVGLIAKVKNARYDGYRLTYGGLDYLALNTHRKGNTITSLGNQIGVGKESDIYVCANQSSRQLVLKLHRLGRISFRTVKANRDYLRNRSTGSWMYLSRLAAQKEHAFMRVLHREGFAVPEPVAWSRHTVVMEFIDAFPLRMIQSVPDPGTLYAELMAMIVSLAQRGLIHGDFNEFNILIKEEPQDALEPRLIPILIDFPQTLSTNHINAEYYFDRDVECIKRYFEKRFKYTSDEPGPHLAESIKDINPETRLDIEVEATGFSKKMAKELDKYVEQVGGDAATSDHEAVPDLDDDPADSDHEEADGVPYEDDVVEESESAVHKDVLSSLQELVIQHDDQIVVPAQPIQLSHDPSVIAEKIKTKKKSSGWAI
ncbi:hypothetical protein AMS68_004600 [Peltaster fructicola]|uniref:Serine/threonine-protein kinase RIO2 n=1 Tax=Peltaster fructicola TaxID=286661 RepID=A0A6H0XWF6_9PEZI|nr:hypothetical protein AMS68_004600 [Peltaster fructicola]